MDIVPTGNQFFTVNVLVSSITTVGTRGRGDKNGTAGLAVIFITVIRSLTCWESEKRELLDVCCDMRCILRVGSDAEGAKRTRPLGVGKIGLAAQTLEGVQIPRESYLWVGMLDVRDKIELGVKKIRAGEWAAPCLPMVLVHVVYPIAPS